MKSFLRMCAMAACVASIAVVGLAGCTPQEAEPEEPAVEEPHYDLVIGQEDDADASLVIANGTGTSIAGVSFKAVDAEVYGDNMLANDTVWEADQAAKVFFAGVTFEGQEAEVPESSSSEAAEAADVATDAAADTILRASYDIQLVSADEKVWTLHQVTIPAMESAEDIRVCIDADSGVAYLEYAEDGETVSTLQTEIEVKNAEEAAAREAEAAAAAEAAAVAQAQQAAQSASTSKSYDSTPSNTGSSTGGSGNAGGSTNVTQKEDACVDTDDLILR